MAESIYDLVVIGGGPGGYVAAIRAAQLGLKVACVEKESKLGGTCLRVGCIPSKAMLDATEKFHLAQHSFKDIGIQVEGLKADLPTMLQRQAAIIDQLSGGITGLFKKNKIDRFTGTATFNGPQALRISGGPEGQPPVLQAKRYLIATGSVPVQLPFMPFNGKTIVSSDQAIRLSEVPKRLVVIGAGAIGLELGSVWGRLGAQVTVLEMLPQIIPGSDEEMARAAERIFRKQGMDIRLGVKVTGAKEENGAVTVSFDAEGKAESVVADVVLVAVGRKPFSDGLGAKEIGIAYDERNRIKVNEHLQTNLPHIYAIGDVIAGPMLAHKAEEEGVAAAEIIAGKMGHVDYNTIPGVVYTAPEFAWVGLTEQQCQQQGTAVKIGKFRFAANGRALCMDEAEGLVKVIADAATDRVLGIHILGPQASSLVAEATVAMAFGASSEDIARTCHAHPTLAEAIKEAALATDKRAIHA